MQHSWTGSYRPKPGRFAARIVFFSIIGIWGFLMGVEKHFVGGLMMILAAAGIGYFAWALFSGRMVLDITTEGVRFSSLNEQQFHLWQDIKRFKIVKIHKTLVVAFDLTEGAAEKQPSAECFLPDVYGWDPEVLTAHLNDCHKHFLKAKS